MPIKQRQAIAYRTLLTNQAAWPRVLGVITCKLLRKGEVPYSDRFERVLDAIASDKFADFVINNDLYLAVTEGSCRRLDQSWPSRLDTRKCMVEASAPGVIQLANLVVFGFCRAVLFFNDSEDLYADSPQNLALRRLCNAFNVPLLEDAASIQFVLERWSREFTDLEKKPKDIEERDRMLRDYLGEDHVILNFDGERTDRSRETLAVIAHDGKKMEMLRFCAGHIREVLAYRRVLTTGTTGAKLRELFTEILTLSDDIRKGLEVSSDRKSIREFLERKICPFKSGPSGGDIQISSKVIDGSCHRVLFFEDPASAHPHQFDIRLLEKAVQSDRTATLFATSTEMAELIV